MKWSSLLLAVLLSAPAAADEVTRTLQTQLTGDAGAFAVENLAGSMRVVLGSGGSVTAVATVHAESDELAGLVRLEQVVGERGAPTLRVRYPVDRYTSYRYPQNKAEGLLSHLFGGGSDVHYDGASVHISQGKGVLLYADVEVRVPSRALDAVFKNAVGPLAGQGLQGRLKFDSGAGNVTLGQLRGEIMANTGLRIGDALKLGPQHIRDGVRDARGIAPAGNKSSERSGDFAPAFGKREQHHGGPTI